MSYEAMEYMLCHAEVTNGAAIWVLLGLARHANDQGVAWPSVQTLGDYAGMQDRAVRKALRQLERDGYIRTVKGGPGVDGRTNRYQLMLKPCMCPRGANGYIRHVPARRSEDERGIAAQTGRGPHGPLTTGPDGPLSAVSPEAPDSEIGVHMDQVPVHMDHNYRSIWTAEDVREEEEKTPSLRLALRAAGGGAHPPHEVSQPQVFAPPPSQAPSHPTTHQAEPTGRRRAR